MAKTGVLIIDDEPLVALYLSDLVEDFGYRVVGTVQSHREAMQLVAGQQLDIALIDVTLRQGDDGVELARELSAACGAAIIFLSGHGDVGSRAQAHGLRPVAILRKPCPPADLEHALRSAANGVASPDAGTQQ